MSMVLIAACLGGLFLLAVVLAGIIGGIVWVMQSERRDAVSTARQGWLSRRSEKDEEGW
jgi:hypothetical protein